MSDVKCACPRHDARECIRVRYMDDLRVMLDVEPSKLRCDDDDECECACHEDNYEPGYEDDEP